MATFQEGRHRGEVLLTPGNRNEHLDSGTLASGNTAEGGTLLKVVSGKYVPIAAADVPVAVAFGAADASSADAPIVVLLRACEVKEHVLKTVGTAPQKAAQLAALKSAGIVPR